GIRPIQQDRVLGRAVLLLLARPGHDRRGRDVADRAFPLRPASQGRARQRPQGGISRRSRAPLSPRRVRDFGGIRRSRWSDPRFPRGARRPRAGLLDAIGPARVHGGAPPLLHPPPPPLPPTPLPPLSPPHPRH